MGRYRYKVVAAKRGMKGRNVYGAFPSRPGQPPRKQTGTLQRSVTYEVNPTTMTARVGTNIKYGRYLEFGTRKMAARPWLRRSLDEMRGEIKAIMRRPMRGGNARRG